MLILFFLLTEVKLMMQMRAKARKEQSSHQSIDYVIKLYDNLLFAALSILFLNSQEIPSMCIMMSNSYII